jgi:hypothetical protein
MPRAEVTTKSSSCSRPHRWKCGLLREIGARVGFGGGETVAAARRHLAAASASVPPVAAARAVIVVCR